MRKFYFFWVCFVISCLTFFFVFDGCTQQVDMPSKVTVHPTTGTGIITGKVGTDTRDAAEGIMVNVGKQNAITNGKGEFTLTNVPAGDRVLINFFYNGYAITQKVVQVKPNCTSYVEAAVIPISTTQNINPSTGGSVQFAGAKVTFQPNSFVDGNGNPFSKTVNVTATYFDPTSKAFLNAFMGEFKGVRTNKSETQIESYGFINVKIMYNCRLKVLLIQPQQLINLLAVYKNAKQFRL